MVIGLAATAWATPPVVLDRVDLVSEDPGLWLNQELPRAHVTPGTTGLRFLTQIRPVVTLPIQDLSVGLSLQSQSLLIERPIAPTLNLAATGGLITRGGLPVGAMAGGSWRPGVLRIGLSAIALSSATWARPRWSAWQILPGVGIGIGRDVRAAAVWME